MLLLKKGHLGAQFMKFHSTAVMLWIRDSFPPPTWCLTVRSMNILCTWSWAPAPKWAIFTFWSTGKAGLIPWRSPWRASGEALPCGCAAVTSETRCPMLKTCHGSSNPHLWDGGGEHGHETSASICLCVWWQSCQGEQACCVRLTWVSDRVWHCR